MLICAEAERSNAVSDCAIMQSEGLRRQCDSPLIKRPADDGNGNRLPFNHEIKIGSPPGIICPSAQSASPLPAIIKLTKLSSAVTMPLNIWQHNFGGNQPRSLWCRLPKNQCEAHPIYKHGQLKINPEFLAKASVNTETSPRGLQIMNKSFVRVNPPPSVSSTLALDLSCLSFANNLLVMIGELRDERRETWAPSVISTKRAQPVKGSVAELVALKWGATGQERCQANTEVSPIVSDGTPTLIKRLETNNEILG